MTLVVSVQASPRDRASWLSLAAEVESAGFDGLHVGGHPGTTPVPFVSLAAAASVTERIRLGTCVLNAGTWEPLALASAVATLDVLSNGRATLGVGAGHTPKEWTAQGRPFPPAGERVDRMMELVESSRALLEGGPPVFFRGTYFTLVDAAAAAARLAPHTPGASEADLLDVPFVWIGTVTEIRRKLQDHQARFGLDRYVVRAGAIPQVREILAEQPDRWSLTDGVPPTGPQA